MKISNTDGACVVVQAITPANDDDDKDDDNDDYEVDEYGENKITGYLCVCVCVCVCLSVYEYIVSL